MLSFVHGKEPNPKQRDQQTCDQICRAVEKAGEGDILDTKCGTLRAYYSQAGRLFSEGPVAR